MRRMMVGAVVAGVLAIAPALASADVITYDFSGTGNLWTYTGVGNTRTLDAAEFTGSVILTVNPAGLAGPNTYIHDGTYAENNAGDWVTAAFTINWNGQTFRPADMVNPLFVSNSVGVYDDDIGHLDFAKPYDSLAVGEGYEREDASSSASMEFRSYDTSWLNGLGFPEPAGLASGSNSIQFANVTYTFGDDPNAPDVHGYSGVIGVSNFTPRATSVPEPSSLSLAAFALAALGCLRILRRRRSSVA